MSWFGLAPFKKFPGAFAKPMAPFGAAAVLVMLGVNSMQNSMMQGAEWKNDPRNPYNKGGASAAH
ncbi:hypothetical protein BROUX41_002796 [Berkeleyomyces rouxiae]|uniref:uncharacterized protein n=1 Tax=Berkeleyomyces rouxiae TaxID=2035830 RepID=UPI003B7F90F1